MTPSIALQLWREQDRLERLGWTIIAVFSSAFNEWQVRIAHWDGPGRTFRGIDRQEVMTEATGWAGWMESAKSEQRDTERAPAMETAAAE